MEDLENILPTFSLKETVILKDSAKRNYTICCRYTMLNIFISTSSKWI